MAILVILLWVGSAVAGWYLFWPWIFMPFFVFGIYLIRITARMKDARRRNGLPVQGNKVANQMMREANIKLLLGASLQNFGIFSIFAVLSWLISK